MSIIKSIKQTDFTTNIYVTKNNKYEKYNSLN